MLELSSGYFIEQYLLPLQKWTGSYTISKAAAFDYWTVYIRWHSKTETLVFKLHNKGWKFFPLFGYMLLSFTI
jgi:hypothetical protein